MRITQLIQELQKAHAEYGNRELVVRVGKRRYRVAQNTIAINTVTGHVSFAVVTNPIFGNQEKMMQKKKLEEIAAYLAERDTSFSPDNPEEIKEFVERFKIKGDELEPILRLVRVDYIIREVMENRGE